MIFQNKNLKTLLHQLIQQLNLKFIVIIIIIMILKLIRLI